MWRRKDTTAGVAGSPNLRLRLYTEDGLPAEALPYLLTRPLAPGLIQSVVMDSPDTIRPINRSEIDGTPENAVFAAAVASSVDVEESYVQQDQEIDGLPFFVIGGTHRYVGAHLQVLSRYVDLRAASYGALVAVPLPEYVFVHVISQKTHVAVAIDTLQNIARRFYDEGDRALTPQVYWWRPGSYEALSEQEALAGGQVPDLRPVGVEIIREPLTVNMHGQDTADLLQRWLDDA